MNKTELVSAVAKRTGHDEKLVHRVISETVEVIMKQVSKNDTVQIVGFGKFSKNRRSGRKYRNFDGEMIKTRAKSVPHFTAGEVFKKRVTGKK